MAYNNGGNRFNNYGSNNNNKVYDSNYYSRLNIKNPDTGDSLSIKYSAGLMTITMEHRNAMNQIEPVVSISLSAFKSMLLKQSLEDFFEYKNLYSSFVVNAILAFNLLISSKYSLIIFDFLIF